MLPANLLLAWLFMHVHLPPRYNAYAYARAYVCTYTHGLTCTPMQAHAPSHPLTNTYVRLHLIGMDNDEFDPPATICVHLHICSSAPVHMHSTCILIGTDDGEIDPLSWHGGERIRDSSDETATEKHIMTLFKEVHYSDHMLPWPFGCGDQSFESYLAPQVAKQRRHLEALAEAQL